ncbi:uncharacterized protein Z518_08714 [Rhinocladiella mackenziei CBS 650.93]|uniref:NACHT domain-containing protein n=1 Tax=Rhinocladiella mackenziei CBS 650.93 TaxID=1442369 RepID=A0A0D2FLB9_9EURO|nr:uncharacterized protein Z518_08714 [Rhinocladiella mackenziei CBS 650.93]KIX02772.1 hypothetical protein Z518_08714 [Rhinocladiella mackenziei CBS 650.93]
MADPFSIGSSIVGVISLAIQITQVVMQFGLDWKDAPHDVKTFMAELQTLNTVLSASNNLILNPDFAEAFQSRSSLLLSQLGPSVSPTSDTKLLFQTCEKELRDLLDELKKRAKGYRVGWERLKGAFLAKNTRKSVENLYRWCQELNNVVSIDTAVLGAATYTAVKESRKEHQEARKEQQKWHYAEADKEMLTWLTSIDYAPQQSDFFSRRQEGTGQWLLTSKQFRDWVDQSNQTLFCPGIPGAGKTICTAIVIDTLFSTIFPNDNVGIAYIYCNFRRQFEQKPIDLLASLLQQLIQGQPSVPQSLKQFHKKHQQKRTRPSIDEISKALHSTVRDYSRTFIIVDALDECQAANGGRRQLLRELFDLQDKTAINLFVTSRVNPEIEREFDGRSTKLEIRASDEDLRRYLEGHMPKLPSFVSSKADLQEEIKTTIVKAADGMFLLVQLHLDSLIGKRSPKAIRDSLKMLPKGSNAYDQAYREAMERIAGQATDSEILAKQVLAWITCAKRPLTTLELRHALAVEVGEPEFDDDNLPDIGDMISVCAGLVTVDAESNIIRLVHYTTQEFFERTQKDWFPKAEADIANVCISYLSFEKYESGFCRSNEEFEARLQTDPLYDYAARNWGHHLRESDDRYRKVDFLENEHKVSASSQALMVDPEKRYADYSQMVPREVTGVHLGAWFGLGEVVAMLLEDGHGPDCKSSYGRTPLSWASENGHETVTRLLIEKGAAADSTDKDGWTPLLWASMNGHEAMVRLLIEKGAVVNSTDNSGGTPLSWASMNGHEAVVRLLTEKDAAVNSTDENGWTSLSWASEKGHDAVVRLLIENGAAVDSTNETGWTPLSWASRNGHEAVVRLLIENGAAVNSTNENGWTPLSWASRNGHEAVVRLLIENGATVDSTDNGWASLSWASENGHEAVVRLLIENGAAVNSTNENGWTPLSWASRNGHEAVVRLLIENGATVDSTDNGWASLSWASEYGHEAVVRLLIEMGAAVDSTSETGWTPLSWASRNGHEAVVRLLIEMGAAVDLTETEYSRTPLSWASRNGHEAVTRLLIEKGAAVDSTDNSGGTPLSWASRNGHEAVVRLLIEKGAAVDSTDDNGWTSLSWASENGHDAVVRLLIEKGAAVDLTDEDGGKPLSWASEKGTVGSTDTKYGFPYVEHRYGEVTTDGELI